MLDDDTVLAQVVGALLGTLAVHRIVLFGSRALGTAGADSDYDLLVVADTDLPPHERAFAARKATRFLGTPLDLLIYTPHEYALLRGWRSSIVAAAEREGQVIYEAA